MTNNVFLLEQKTLMGDFVVGHLPEAIMSNDINHLLGHLVDDIRTSSSPSLLVASVIVPDSSIRAWLSHELATHHLSLLRVNILLVEEALEGQPSDIPLLARHHLIPLLMAFFEHLQNTEAEVAIPEDHRSRYHLARRLRLPFALRAFLGEKAWFSKDPAAELLWQKFQCWSPLRICSDHQMVPNPPQVPLFLFGFSSLNNLLLNQFLSLPTLRRLYLLSPCMLFWADQSSDREVRYLLEAAHHATRPSLEQLEQFLNHRHRLLANSGQVGRQFMLLIEETHLQTVSSYVLPKALVKPPYTDYLLPELLAGGDAEPTLLDYVKADLLLLVGTRSSPHSIPRDRSIEIHGAPTPLREVEALFARLSTEATLPPASVIILATDMPRYRAAIEQVFADKIPYQIWNTEQPSGLITACRMMVHLLMSKGTLRDWLQLLRHTVFQKTLSISKDEAESLIDYLASRAIRWGLSASHQLRYLSSRAITAVTTTASFEEEREALLDTLMTPAASHTLDVSLLGPIGRFFEFLATMESWWQLPLIPSSYAPMARYATLFATIVDSIISGSAGGFEEEALITAVASFTTISEETKSPHIPASEALRLFFTLIDTALSRHRLHLAAPIIVAEFGSFQPFPAQLVAILGAEEGSLPAHSEEQLLARLDRMVPKIPASNTFFDRYAFLEVLLAAQNLFISYQSYAFDTREKIPYSPVVADLLFHIDTNYTIDNATPSSIIHTTHCLARPHPPTSPSRHPSPALFLDTHPPSLSISITTIQHTARSPLDIYYKEQYALTHPFADEESLFIKPWKIRAHLERDIATRTPSHPHPSYSKAFNALQATLRVMNISPQPVDIHLLPTAATPSVTDTAIYASCIDSSPSLIGTWKGIVTQGMILTSDSWHQELFTRWPEVALRTYLAERHEISLCNQAIIIKESRTLQLPLTHTINSWAQFAALAATMPFPFSFDIVKLLLTNPTPDAILDAILTQAAERKGSWQAFASAVTPSTCATLLPEWNHYATLLWSDFFSLLETP